MTLLTQDVSESLRYVLYRHNLNCYGTDMFLRKMYLYFPLFVKTEMHRVVEILHYGRKGTV